MEILIHTTDLCSVKMVLGQEKHTRLRSLFFSDLLLLQFLVYSRLYVHDNPSAVLPAVRANTVRRTGLLARIAYRKTRRHKLKV